MSARPLFDQPVTTMRLPSVATSRARNAASPVTDVESVCACTEAPNAYGGASTTSHAAPEVATLPATDGCALVTLTSTTPVAWSATMASVAFAATAVAAVSSGVRPVTTGTAGLARLTTTSSLLPEPTR